MNQPMVIGSGPTSLATISALISLGIRPIVVDVGFHPQLNTEQNSMGRQITIPNKSIKTWNGSSFSFWQVVQHDVRFNRSLKVRPSYGLGGFSRVWGATLLTSRKEQFEQATVKAVEELFPHESPEREMNELLSYFQSFGKSAKFHIQRPRHAVHYSNNGGRYCEYNKKCLDGCPKDAIWSSSQLLKKYLDRNLIDYRPYHLVQRLEFECSTQSVLVTCCEITTGDLSTIRVPKVYLATGPIGTGIILLRSRFFEQLAIDDCQTQFMVALRITSKSPMSNKKETLLSKVWVVDNKDNSLTQVYSSGKSLVSRVQALYPNLPQFIFHALNRCSSRIHPLIRYLPTSSSGKILLRYDAENNRIEVSTRKSRKFPTRFLSICRLLWFLFTRGFIVLKPTRDQVGSGYHFGSSLRVGTHIKEDGSLIPCPNVFVVDASSMQEIDPGGVVYNSMLNTVALVGKGLGNT